MVLRHSWRGIFPSFGFGRGDQLSRIHIMTLLPRVPDQEITPWEVYLNRRQFMRAQHSQPVSRQQLPSTVA